MFVCWLLEALDALEGLEALGFFKIECKVTTFF